MTSEQGGADTRTGESGIALVVTILVLVLVSVLMAGFITVIVADSRASGTGGDQTKTYAAAHAGLEKLTSDLDRLFRTDYSPSAAQVNALATGVPAIDGFQFLAPDNSVGYQVQFNPDASGNPASNAGGMISAGPFQGFRGLVTPYNLVVTARSSGGAEVRMRRTLQTVSIPVFQFGIFSENDLSFFAGPNFNFGGRVHTNGNLFLAEGNGATLTMSDRVTAVGEVIRTRLSNGWDTNNSYTGNVAIQTSPTIYRNLARAEGSLVDTIGSAANEPVWTDLSGGTYAGNILNGRTGARALSLPLVSGGAGPIDLIRRPAQNSNENVASPAVYEQRFFGLAGIRILLSDRPEEILSLPTVTGSSPVQLLTQTVGGAPLAASGGAAPYVSPIDTPLVNGWIKIERRGAGGGWADITAEVLGLGVTGRNLSNGTLNVAGNACPLEPQPDAVIRLQRVRDVPTWPHPCGINPGGNLSPQGNDYWPLALYDTREGNLRDVVPAAPATMTLGGIMSYVELDVANLRRYLLGQIGASGPQTVNENGFVVYFSDRRNNKNTANVETGEYGFEDVVNPAAADGTPNSALDPGEDLNPVAGVAATLDIYGRLGVNAPTGAIAPFVANALSTATLTDASVARANRPVHFRRALKIVHGGGAPVLPGLTIASENPVYVEGNYNAQENDTLANPHGAYAIVADAVTLLSRSWNDIQSFTSPNSTAGRQANTTGYRMAIIAGKSLSFARPSYGNQDFGTDGGAHNFLRYLEKWDGAGQTLNYRGSIISFYTSRQAVGTFKCCTTVYAAPNRAYNFDTEFLTPALLPPATPMFRDVNTLTFRQLLRPNQ